MGQGRLETRLRLRRRGAAICLTLALAGCAAAPERAGEPLPAPLPPPVAAPPIAEVPPLPPVVVRAPDPFPAAAGAELEPLPPSATNLWERIVKGYAIPDLVDDPLVAKWEQYYSERPDYFARMIDRGRRYLYHIVSEIEERKMPLDLALLPMIESAMNPNALSRARAAGIWQFMPSTGKHYGLEQNFWHDSRRDVVAATDSALDYLGKLHGDFNDWQLALAGYNWGEGNVGKALAKNRSKGRPGDYASLDMPAETRNYLPKLQAVKNIIADPERFGIVLAEVPDSPYFTVVKTTREMDVKVAAGLAEMSVDEFLTLNPQHNRPVIAGADQQSILLPIDNAEIFAAKLKLTDQPLVSWQAYRLKPNETLPQVATKYAMSVETLRAVNGIGSRSRVPVGHMLLVPSQRPSNEAALTLTEAVFTTVPAGRTFYYTAKRGDTLQRVAVRYGVTVQELKTWNAISHDMLAAGQKVRVTSDVVPVARAGGSTKRAVATRGAGKQAKSHKAVPAKPIGNAIKPVPTARMQDVPKS